MCKESIDQQCFQKRISEGTVSCKHQIKPIAVKVVDENQINITVSAHIEEPIQYGSVAKFSAPYGTADEELSWLDGSKSKLRAKTNQKSH